MKENSDNEDDNFNIIRDSSKSLKLYQDNSNNNEQEIEKQNNELLNKNEKEFNFNNDDNRKTNYLNEEERLTLSHDLKEDLKKKSQNILKLGSKILCPNKDCFSKSIIYLNPFFYDVNSDCGKHKNKMNIIDYVKNSGISKENKEFCDNCKKTYQFLINNNQNLYKCSCGKNICQSCKDLHLNNNNDNNHNMVDFKVKDYTCYCNNQGKKFKGYCIECNKNYCEICIEKHNNHKNNKNFDGCKIEKDILRQKLIEQKKIINKCNNIMDKGLKDQKNLLLLIKKN